MLLHRLIATIIPLPTAPATVGTMVIRHSLRTNRIRRSAAVPPLAQAHSIATPSPAAAVRASISCRCRSPMTSWVCCGATAAASIRQMIPARNAHLRARIVPRLPPIPSIPSIHAASGAMNTAASATPSDGAQYHPGLSRGESRFEITFRRQSYPCGKCSAPTHRLPK